MRTRLSRRIGDLGERRAINLITQWLRPSKHNLVGLEDDAAIYDIGCDELLVLSIDRIPLSYGLSHGIVNLEELGRYFACSVLNDAVAKAARPLALLVALGMPKTTKLEALQSLVRGIDRVSQEYHVPVVGGDTKRTENLDLVGTVVGKVKRSAFVTRSGAEVGDIICITGVPGLFAANVVARMRKQQVPTSIADSLLREYKSSIGIPIQTMRLVSLLKAARASIDISDGLLGDLNKIATLSDVGMEIDLRAIPATNGMKRLARHIGLDTNEFALNVGGDLQIALCIRPELWPCLSRHLGPVGSRVYAIGKVIDQEGMFLVSDGLRRRLSKITEWQSFSKLPYEELIITPHLGL